MVMNRVPPALPQPAPAGERLQKLLATAGFGSRRQIETWIEAGRVTVNGEIARLGDRATPADEVALDGKVVRGPSTEVAPDGAGGATMTPQPAAVLIYHKPVGEMTTRHDPQGRPTVFEKLPPVPGGAGRWVVVGRLDFMTSGLLLFTNDGELAHRLMHPSSEIQREYRVEVDGLPTRETMDKLEDGLRLEDGWARFDRVMPEPDARGGATFRVLLKEGRNREVRRLWSAAGHEVQRLQRVRFGAVELPRDLAPGAAVLASAAQVEALRRIARPR